MRFLGQRQRPPWLTARRQREHGHACIRSPCPPAAQRVWWTPCSPWVLSKRRNPELGKPLLLLQALNEPAFRSRGEGTSSLKVTSCMNTRAASHGRDPSRSCSHGKVSTTCERPREDSLPAGGRQSQRWGVEGRRLWPGVVLPTRCFLVRNPGKSRDSKSKPGLGGGWKKGLVCPDIPPS